MELMNIIKCRVLSIFFFSNCKTALLISLMSVVGHQIIVFCCIAFTFVTIFYLYTLTISVLVSVLKLTECDKGDFFAKKIIVITHLLCFYGFLMLLSVDLFFKECTNF